MPKSDPFAEDKKFLATTYPVMHFLCCEPELSLFDKAPLVAVNAMQLLHPLICCAPLHVNACLERQWLVSKYQRLVRQMMQCLDASQRLEWIMPSFLGASSRCTEDLLAGWSHWSVTGRMIMATEFCD